MHNYIHWTMYCVQANPSDPDNFPFVVLGNKVDIDSGNSRVVCPRSYSLPIICMGLYFHSEFNHLFTLMFNRFLRRRQKHGVQARETFHILRPLPRKIWMLMQPSNALQRMLWKMKQRKKCKRHSNSKKLVKNNIKWMHCQDVCFISVMNKMLFIK